MRAIQLLLDLLVKDGEEIEIVNRIFELLKSAGIIIGDKDYIGMEEQYNMNVFDTPKVTSKNAACLQQYALVGVVVPATHTGYTNYNDRAMFVDLKFKTVEQAIAEYKEREGGWMVKSELDRVGVICQGTMEEVRRIPTQARRKYANTQIS